MEKQYLCISNAFLVNNSSECMKLHFEKNSFIILILYGHKGKSMQSKHKILVEFENLCPFDDCDTMISSVLLLRGSTNQGSQRQKYIISYSYSRLLTI